LKKSLCYPQNNLIKKSSLTSTKKKRDEKNPLTPSDECHSIKQKVQNMSLAPKDEVLAIKVKILIQVLDLYRVEALL
jgi:hypothetical protein